MNDYSIRLILTNLRAAGNVGAILRTADACGVELVYTCGHTPHPRVPGDTRPPHIVSSNSRSIAKTALGAEQTMSVRHFSDASEAIAEAKHDGFEIIVIEQAETALNLFDYTPKTTAKLALVLGNEVDGVDRATFALTDHILEIPMGGTKESLNVASAAAVVLYQLRFGR